MEYELQKQILKAKEKLSHDESLPKNVRKKHTAGYVEARSKVAFSFYLRVYLPRNQLVCMQILVTRYQARDMRIVGRPIRSLSFR